VTDYRLSPAARRDLSEIWDYTADTWGTAQADRYVVAIRDACENLANGSRVGRAVDAVRPSYRRLAVGMHGLFYRHSAAGVTEVVRILHQRMDAVSHLND